MPLNIKYTQMGVFFDENVSSRRYTNRIGVICNTPGSSHKINVKFIHFDTSGSSVSRRIIKVNSFSNKVYNFWHTFLNSHNSYKTTHRFVSVNLKSLLIHSISYKKKSIPYKPLDYRKRAQYWFIFLCYKYKPKYK